MNILCTVIMLYCGSAATIGFISVMIISSVLILILGPVTMKCLWTIRTNKLHEFITYYDIINTNQSTQAVCIFKVYIQYIIIHNTCVFINRRKHREIRLGRQLILWLYNLLWRQMILRKPKTTCHRTYANRICNHSLVFLERDRHKKEFSILLSKLHERFLFSG